MVDYSKSKGIRTVIFTSGVVERNISEEFKKEINKELKRIIKEIDEKEPDNIFLKEKIRNSYKNMISGKYTSLSKEKLSYLKSIGLDKIVFDYQGYEYDTDHMLMGRGEKARLSLLKSIINASFVGLDIDVHFVPMKPNYKEIGDILEMLEIAQVKNISILNFIPQGRGRQNSNELQLSKEELNEFFELLDKYSDNYSGNIRIGIPLQEENTHKCNAGIEKLNIKFDGTILPCPAFKELIEDECKKYNIKLPSIYNNLEDVKIPGKGTRNKPLCKQIYNYK